VFAAALGRGAFLDGAPIAVREPAGLVGTTIAGSRSFARAARTHGVEEVRFIHSLALRIALVAAGEIDAAVTTKGANDWDLAAADLLVHEAGGTLVDLSGAPMRYLHVAAPRRLPIAAASLGLIGDVVALLAARTAAPVAG
jgi:myo-inositol-1(or 4)-monophosphatase